MVNPNGKSGCQHWKVILIVRILWIAAYMLWCQKYSRYSRAKSCTKNSSLLLIWILDNSKGTTAACSSGCKVLSCFEFVMNRMFIQSPFMFWNPGMGLIWMKSSEIPRLIENTVTEVGKMDDWDFRSGKIRVVTQGKVWNNMRGDKVVKGWGLL